MIARALLTAFLLLFISGGARADWEWTRWGMTPEQVAKASKGKATLIDPNAGVRLSTFAGSRVLATMPGHQAAGRVFEVRFGFDSERRLNEVTLYTDGDAFFDLERALTAIYGAPIQRSSTPSRMWNDPTKGNAVRLIRVTSAIVQYRPIPKGL